MSQNWDDFAKGWDANKDVIEYSHRAFQTLNNTLPLDGLNVFDFGCGTGLLTEKVAKSANQVVALDPSEKMINVLNRKNICNVKSYAEYLNEKLITKNNLANQFDLVIASSALGFVENYSETLLLIHRLLKTNGQFIQWDWLKQHGGDTGFSAEEIKVELNNVGFQKVEISIPFTMGEEQDAMPVIMAIGSKA